MTYTITSQCIGCDRCLSICPTDAIQHYQGQYWIDPTACNNCAGFYSVAQCAAVCPTNQGCIPGSSAIFKKPELLHSGDYWERWFTTYNRMVARLHATKHAQYWEDWFDRYSQLVSRLIQDRKSDQVGAET